MKDAFFHRTMLTLVLAMAAFTAIGMSLSGISVRPEQVFAKIGLYSAILLGAWFYRFRKVDQLVFPIMMVFWLGVFSDLHIFPMFVAGRQDVPASDAVLASIDRWMGIETPEVMATAAQVPWLQTLLHHAYSTLVFSMTLSLLATSLLNRKQAAKEFLIACVLAVFICFPIFAVFQAKGPWTYYGYTCSINQDAYMHVFAELKAAPHYVMDLGYRNGLICFPSFHTILAALAGVALWSVPRLRWLGALWATLIIISTMTTGTHYVIDVVSGLGVVVLSVAGAKLWSRWEAARQTSREQANGHTRQSDSDSSSGSFGTEGQTG